MSHIIIKTCFVFVFLLQAVSSHAFPSVPVSYCASGRQEGLIGTTEAQPIDNPVDNIFHVSIDQTLTGEEDAWLVYELAGVADHTAVARSINDQLSVGGQVVKQRKGWHMQRERIHARWLKSGDNVIRFTLPEGAQHSYRVRNLSIEISEPNCRSVSEQLVFNPASNQYDGNQAYIKGFASGNSSELISLTVDGQPARVFNQAFEGVVRNKDSNQTSWTAEVEATYANGMVTCDYLPLAPSSSADYYYPIQPTSYRTEKRFATRKQHSIHLGGASLHLTAGALAQPTNISITTLRPVDIPALDAGMVNVTGQHAGYRFLPHRTLFEQEVKLHLAYDESKIPDGYTAQDIRTYFFDENTHHWIALPQDTVLTAKAEVLSRTTHFTDMINAIIQVPESPEVNAYNSTSMKGIKAANPTAAVSLMDAPRANNTGSAALSYPIKLPAGRNGMQPQLSISYNSGGGNGWLGLGWNLNIPAISVDTRWGVPRYLKDWETETYTMNGEQLTPVAHRGEPVRREEDKQFYPRVEGRFHKIIRRKDNTEEYFWEVTDKSGVVYRYGGRTGVDPQAVLRDADSNIAHWALVEVRDLNGNFVRYHYDKQEDKQQLYVSRITYTGHGQSEGKYTVLFDKRVERRKDVTINARSGFKQVTDELLEKITVKYGKEEVRSYQLWYHEGPFFKTLLDSISEYDADGKHFNAHGFTYYDETEGGTKLFGRQETWNLYDDDIKGGFLENGLFTQKASALSGTQSTSVGAGMAVTVGPNDVNMMTKSNTAGVNYSYSRSWSSGRLTTVDINGDGLTDKVVMVEENKRKVLKYRPQLPPAEDGMVRFGEFVPIHGADEFLRETSNTHDVGIESNFVVFAGLSRSTTKSKTKIYFTDANGDGLIDIVKNGRVKFNHINEQGEVTFSEDSRLTPSPIYPSGSLDPKLMQTDEAELAALAEQFPLHDVVRMWTAPYDGSISIDGSVALIRDRSEERKDYTTADGVRVSIEHQERMRWKTTLSPTDYSEHTASVQSLRVKKGERIFFRVHSIEDGAYDQVRWNPTVRYTRYDNSLQDANGLPLYTFDAAQDYLLASPQSIGAPIDGKVTIEGRFGKPVTSDDIRVEILKGEVTVFAQEYAWNETADLLLSHSEVVKQGDAFRVRVVAATNIDWTKLDWSPVLYYTESYDANHPEVQQDGENLIELQLVPEYSFYAQPLVASRAWVADADASVQVAPKVSFSAPVSGNMVFSVKKQGELVAKQYLKVEEGNWSVDTERSSATISDISVSQDEQFYFEYHTDNRALAYAISDATATLTLGRNDTKSVAAGLHTVIDPKTAIFGSQYRHWGQFAYNGNGSRGQVAIDESLLHIDLFDTDTEPEKVDLSNAQSEKEMEAQFNNSDVYRADQSPFILLVASGETQSWLGSDDLTYVQGGVISSSRMGLDQLADSEPMTSGSGRAWAVTKVTKSTSTALAANAKGLGANGSTGNSRVLLDFMDMNGDRYPDVLGERGIQYSTPVGGFEESFQEHAWEFNHRTQLLSGGASVGGSFSKPSKEAANSTNRVPFTILGQAPSITASKLWSKDEADYTWMDVNGDGLPDRVDQTQQRVRLNLGYGFAGAESWGSFVIREGNSNNQTTGLGVNIKNTSIAAGVGYAKASNHLNATLQDINGDGLVDKLVVGPDKPGLSWVDVYLNTGEGFDEQVTFRADIASLSESSSSTASTNVAFTVGIPLVPPAPVVKLCINPKVLGSQGFNRQGTQIADFNGDGYPDYLVSEEGKGEIKVRPSIIGKTNMLKSVERPLGASIVLDYEREGNTYRMPNNVWALSRVEVTDGHKDDGADKLLTTFTYEDGYHDRHERDFYGFAKVTTQTRDAQSGEEYRHLVQTFHNQDYYTKGLLLTETVADAKGNKYTEKENRYRLLEPATGEERASELPDYYSGRVFPALTQTVQRYYEGEEQAGKSTRTLLSYGTYGNVKKIEDLGDVDRPEDDLLAEVSYHTLTGPYVVNQPKHIEVSGRHSGSQGQTYRVREAEIDNIGQVTAIRQYLDKDNVAVHSLSYDEYGNLKEVKRAANEKGERLSINYEYDQAVHTYVEKVSNSYGYTSKATYDYAFGQMLSSTDLNGQEVSYQLDALGRVKQIKGPYERQGGAGYTIRFAYHPKASIPWALTQHYDPAHPGNPLETVTFVDGLGRVLQTKKDVALFQGEGKADEEAMVVSGKVIYDAYGRAVEAYQPRVDQGKPGEFLSGEGEHPTKTTYDVLSRAERVTLPDGAVSTMGYGFGSDREGNKQFLTTTTDANKISTEQYTDARGRVTAVRNAGKVWTSFIYNAMSEQVSATDDQGHSTISEYDQLGRRISREHPDAGLTSYTYDLSGNLTSLTTANLKQGSGPIVYQYEYERLTDISYPDNSENDVHYVYGEAGASENRVGRIVMQEDASGAQEFFYGPLGEVVKNVRTVVIPQHDEQTYVTEWQYDTWNRLTEMTYADGEKVSYRYNTGGLLKSMSGKKQSDKYDYVTQLGYDKFEQRVFLSYGNGTKTSYSYEDERRRLSSMTATTAAGRAMMDNQYGYDQVNNILSLKNNAEVPASNLMGGSSQYSYEYDELYRLTQAEGKFTGSNHTHRYSLEMQYNSVGGITEKQQVHERKSNEEGSWKEQKKTSYELSYQYGDSQPHAPVHIGQQKYSYDANGNQTGWTHDVSGQRRQIIWDEENRIRAIADNGSAHHYIYDASGTRVLKGKSNGQSIRVNGEWKAGSGNMGNYTVYVNPYLVLRSGGYTKHYYIEGQRIVSKLGSGLNNKGKGPLKAGSEKVNYSKKQQDSREGIVKNLKWLGQDGQLLTAGNSGKTPPGQLKKIKGGDGSGDGKGKDKGGKDKNAEKFQYYYHPDHLGSTSYITDASGEVYQHLEYFAFGETFVEEHSNRKHTPYKFNGKELDEETGLYYYGARYYDAQTSIWLSVDPLASKLPSHSPYAYGLNNPILFIDPDGQYPWPFHVRSFIATSTTGGGFFRGDGRGPSVASDLTVTSRVRSSFTVDPAQGYVSNPRAVSDPTVFFGAPSPIPGPGPNIAPIVERGIPEASIADREFAKGIASFSFSHSGKDPITPEMITPSLDVHSSLTVAEDLENGVLSITGSFSGDKFPSTEAFVVDQSGKNKVFLGAQKEDGGLHSLLGDNKKSLFNVNLQIQFDGKGNFTGVQQGDQTYSVKDWNKRVQDGF